MEFDLRQIEAFITIVDHGGFGAASKVMGLSQAAVSERIANLETSIGMRLLDRNAREIRTTAVGQRFYELARQLLQQRDAISLELAELAGVVRGTLNIGASTIPGEYILPRLLPGFCMAHPAVELNIQIHDSARIIDDVLEGTLEAGIVGIETSNKHLHSVQLWEDRLVLVVPRDHRLAANHRVKIEELSTEPFIMREQGSGTRRLMQQVMAERGVEPESVCITLSSTTAVKEAVICGLGVTLISRRAVEKELGQGSLIEVALQDLEFIRHFQLITSHGRTQSPLCRRFNQYLIECFRQGRD